MTLRTRLQLLVWKWEDAFRYHPKMRSLVSLSCWLRSRFAKTPSEILRLHCKAVALAEPGDFQELLVEEYRNLLTQYPAADWQDAALARDQYIAQFKASRSLTRTVILKNPGDNGEKGVLLCYFEYNLARLMTLTDSELSWLEQHYHIILVASWSPTDYALIGCALQRMKSPLFLQCANEQERPRLTHLHPRLLCLPGLACDWVSPKFYQPKPHPERSIDLLMVANWGAFKRHWEFFLALRQMPAHLRVVLIGQKEGGRDKAYVQNLAARMSVPQNLEFMESLSIDQVSEIQCDSKVSIILSRREGGCVAAVESLFAGCALAMRNDAHIGSSAHIHESTGKRLSPRRLAKDLLHLLRLAPKLQAREWATQHIANTITLSKINEALKAHSQSIGSTWTQDLAIPYWRPHPRLESSDATSNLESSYITLNERFPSLFTKDLACRSHQ